MGWKTVAENEHADLKYSMNSTEGKSKENHKKRHIIIGAKTKYRQRMMKAARENTKDST